MADRLEWKIVRVRFEAELEHELNELGKIGWGLYQIFNFENGYTLIFKRAKIGQHV